MSKLILSLLLFGFFAPVLFLSAGPGIKQSASEQAATAKQEEFTAAQIEFFESKVRPILVEHCYECHGADADPPEGGLSLVSRKSILAGGDSGPGIDLDNLAESNILSAVNYGELFEMPPDGKLGEDQIAIIRKWVMEKAPWPADSDIDVARADEFDLEKRKAEHWCWQPIRKATPPGVDNKDWPLGPIDNFILSELEQAKLTPAKPADRRTWLRRVTFDITGLPPTLDEIEGFINDDSEDAFEKVVDRLLLSPHYGERWARHWMDLIRYAETYGHEFDYPLPHAYQYRDYLIRAFNADVPYDDFVVEHIAGDLMDYPRLHPDTQIDESTLGTGFWFLGEATHGPVDVKGDEAGRIDNQIDVMGKTFLGLTIACARCHDHKFDAISAKDYYGIAGFLQSSRRQNVMLDPDRKIKNAFQQAVQESEKAVGAIETFINSLPEDDDYCQSFKSYMTAAVLFLQQDHNWLLPDRLVLEGESLKQLEKTNGNARRQDIKGWSGGGQIWWTDASINDELELELNAPVAGNYEIMAEFTKAPDYGIVQVIVNGETAGDPVDLYAEKVTRSGELTLGKFVMAAGPQKIRFRITGKNEMALDRYMVGVDYFVLRADRRPENETDTSARIESLCDKYKLEPDQLRQWVAAIQDPEADNIGHPFYLLRKSAEAKIDLNSDEADHFFTGLSRTIRELHEANETWLQQNSVLLPPLKEGWINDWDRQGFAFLHDNWYCQLNNVDPDPIWSTKFAPPHSGLLGNRFQGVLRSPTFEITHSNIFYYVSARKAKIRLIIDGFRLDENNALLFNNMSLPVDTDGKWKWVRQGGDLKNYIGHRAFIEIIDQGDGFIGIQEVRCGDQPNPEQQPSEVSIRFHYLDEGSWHDARFNKGYTPLELVVESLANSMRASKMYSARDATVHDEQLFNFMVRHHLIPDADYESLEQQISDVREQLAAIDEKIPAPVLAIGMVDGSPENEFVFVRGNHKNPGESVSRAPITALRLSDVWKDELAASGRWELARNMVSLDHPLTRRVIVNRIWHHLTGQGIVASVDNFGVLGSKPTHPELLDYLANEFSDDDWSIKNLIRRIVLSQTYRMSSTSDVDASETDPKNNLLYKFRIRRLQGEAIRDSILAVSGELDKKMFGPSVPIHLTAFMQGRGRPGKSGPLDGNGRRSLYIAIRRNFLSPMMLVFDSPVPFNSIGRRTNSNVPAQALILMNDPMVIDQAGKWAKRLLEEHADADERLVAAFVNSMGREPTELEVRELTSFLKTQSESYGDEATEIQLWSDLCHVLFNLKEFIYIK